ncbi:hypothetical protein DAVIS_01102 [Mycobacterium marinum]|uniref:Transmembrane protein n=2 Tax=Mycobacterium marinum TaxID=1781 RepID=A0A3E2N0D1_MYCMR|nr:hypothetical protein [Mycobacterium marinum]RFZ45819.1 hypothetical protein DAVIS_01102 [Mycobacterium marinum]
MTGPHSETEDTKQISVAELLARNGNVGAPAVTRRRRRRRGDTDSITVAELTGEIPIIRDDHHDERSAPSAPAETTETVAPTSQAKPGNGRVEVDEPAPASRVQPESVVAPAEATEPPQAAEEPAAGQAGRAAYWSEPEPRWPKSEPITRTKAGPERSEYPRPLRHTEDSDAAGQEPGAEDMSPDPVGHYGDTSVDVSDSEAESEVEDSAYVRSFLQASEGISDQALYGGQSLADEVARRRGESSPSTFDEEEAEADEEQGARPLSGKLAALWRGTLVVLQSILAVVFGAGLFIAFDQLWRWNSIVALVLSVLVILGLVVGVRVVRKTEDIGSTLIAVAVGALITLGPLALLQSG